jgi:hypothetical protein
MGMSANMLSAKALNKAVGLAAKTRSKAMLKSKPVEETPAAAPATPAAPKPTAPPTPTIPIGGYQPLPGHKTGQKVAPYKRKPKIISKTLPKGMIRATGMFRRRPPATLGLGQGYT